MKLYDISQELINCAVFPGDTAPQLMHVRNMPADAYNMCDLTICVHNGTHLDAPRHFIADGKTIDQLDPSIFYGDCTVAELSGNITASDLRSAYGDNLPERIILKGKLQLTPSACEYIVSENVILVGVESQSIGASENPAEVHCILLGAGIVALEGLALAEIVPGRYTLSAFPVNIGGCDGAPVRAVLISAES